MTVGGLPANVTQAVTAANAEYAAGIRDRNAGRYKQAMTEFRKAAAAGDGDAMAQIGRLYDDRQNFSKAMLWYCKGVRADSAEAMRRLGKLYYYGQGVRLNYTKALTWTRKAAAAGDARAVEEIGVYYVLGHGAPRIWP